MDDSRTHQKHAPLVKSTWGESIPGINGLVLAGGLSSRMGKDKTTIEYHGIPQRDYMVQLLSGFVSQVFISCHPDRVPVTDHPVLKDTFLDLGPMGGVLSAFRFDPNSAWLAVACDIPMLDEKIIAYLIEQRDPLKVATCFYNPEAGFPEPLLTIWEPRAYPVLLQYLGQGRSCLRKSLINADTKQLSIDHPEILRNANTPEESQSMQRLLHNNDFLKI
jgi:molybdopterin-guanine dinucleotide biosynthesis protein A